MTGNDVRRWPRLVCCLLVWAVAPCAAPAQEKAAVEAELGMRASGLVDTDPLRSDELGFLGSVDGALLGTHHLDRFLTRFRAMLETGSTPTEANPLSVFHFGGSHVQAGRIGWAFRKRLSEDRPGLVVSRGVLPPHRLAGENGPPEVRWSSSTHWTGQRSAHRRHSGQWGLTGMEATAIQPDTIRIWNGEREGCLDDVDILAAPGSQWEWAPATADTLSLWSPDSLARLQGIWIKERDADLVYHDLGGNGASTAAWLRHPHLVDQWARFPADLAILAWGINDAHMGRDRFSPDRFKERYGQLIEVFRTAHPDLDILLVTNNDSHYRRRHNPNAERVRTAMAELVEEWDVACWDLYGALGGAHSMDRLKTAGFAARDHLHFNRTGYELIGELLYDALVRAAFPDHETSQDTP